MSKPSCTLKSTLCLKALVTAAQAAGEEELILGDPGATRYLWAKVYFADWAEKYNQRDGIRPLLELVR